MKNCVNCQQETKNPKYCSTSCAAVVTNKNRFREFTPKKYYCRCGKFLADGWRERLKTGKVCYDCNVNYVDWSLVTLDDLFKKLKTHQAHARLRGLSRTAYNKHKKPRVCYNCQYCKYIEVCHIKQVNEFDRETPISIVNHIDNLVALCPNCHWEFDHKLLVLKMPEAGNAPL